MSHIFRIIRQDDNGYRICQAHFDTAVLANIAKDAYEKLAGEHKQTFFVLPICRDEVCQYCEGENDRS